MWRLSNIENLLRYPKGAGKNYINFAPTLRIFQSHQNFANYKYLPLYKNKHLNMKARNILILRVRGTSNLPESKIIIEGKLISTKLIQTFTMF
jgi:hypothetical protein